MKKCYFDEHDLGVNRLLKDHDWYLNAAKSKSKKKDKHTVLIKPKLRSASNVKKMVKEYEENNIIPPPIEFQDDIIPPPPEFRDDKITRLKQALKGAVKS